MATAVRPILVPDSVCGRPAYHGALRSTRGLVMLLAAAGATLMCHLGPPAPSSSQPEPRAFVEGRWRPEGALSRRALERAGTDAVVARVGQKPYRRARQDEVVPIDQLASSHVGQGKYNGLNKAEYLRRLEHRRWAAQFTYPRIWGFVQSWDDQAGEGIVLDQEKTQKYLVIRDEITRCYHLHKTLQLAEMVEFFATDEVDEVSGLPLAKNVSAAFGTYVKGSEEYRDIMLRHGGFPKRWSDTYDEYDVKLGEWWLDKRWSVGYKPKKK